MAQWGIIQAGGGMTNSGWSFPTDSRVVTDEFGYRESPGGIGSTYHQGLDIGAGMGEPIYAATGGNVTMAGYYGGYGNAVIIDHGNGIETLYGHMSEVAVREGAVAQG
ncbi:M23 family metallopeptidase [Eubacterium aggregans]|uniref:M23 family metallopeptidase n=1 Tax=Eubacterium aggregans TaxID=81409 RepID=UPI003F3D8CCA